MNRRFFIETLSALTPALLLNPVFTSIPEREGKTWLWTRPGSIRELEDWKSFFRKCRTHNIHGVLLEVYNGNTCWFTHPSLPVEKPLLEELIPVAAENGVELHAWMWTMICNNPGILARHPEWYAINGLGKSAAEHPAYVDYYRFMCARNPGVRDFVATTVRALCNIEGLSGVHLDYVRLPDVILAEALQPRYNIRQDREYPQYDYCYCDHCVAGFRSLHDTIPATEMEDPGLAGLWLDYRMQGISALVNDHLAPLFRASGKKTSAAVFPNWQSVRQNWLEWDLDNFFPMLYHGFYNEDAGWIEEKTRQFVGQQKFQRPVTSGLFLGHLNISSISSVAGACLGAGADGIALFDYHGMSDQHWQAIMDLK